MKTTRDLTIPTGKHHLPGQKVALLQPPWQQKVLQQQPQLQPKVLQRSSPPVYPQCCQRPQRHVGLSVPGVRKVMSHEC